MVVEIISPCIPIWKWVTNKKSHPRCIIVELTVATSGTYVTFIAFKKRLIISICPMTYIVGIMGTTY